MSNNFLVGDRVEAIKPVDGNRACIGLAGTVIKVNCMGFDVLVEFDEDFRGGHWGDGLGKDGHCRYGRASSFELLCEDDKIPKVEISYDEFML